MKQRYEYCLGTGKPPSLVVKRWTVGPVGDPRRGLCPWCGHDCQINGEGNVHSHKTRRIGW